MIITSKFQTGNCKIKGILPLLLNILVSVLQDFYVRVREIYEPWLLFIMYFTTKWQSIPNDGISILKIMSLSYHTGKMNHCWSVLWMLLFDRPRHKPVWTRSLWWKHCSIHEGACIIRLQGLGFRWTSFTLFRLSNIKKHKCYEFSYIYKPLFYFTDKSHLWSRFIATV